VKWIAAFSLGEIFALDIRPDEAYERDEFPFPSAYGPHDGIYRAGVYFGIAGIRKKAGQT
jgi:hypothetical protein